MDPNADGYGSDPLRAVARGTAAAQGADLSASARWPRPRTWLRAGNLSLPESRALGVEPSGWDVDRGAAADDRVCSTAPASAPRLCVDDSRVSAAFRSTGSRRPPIGTVSREGTGCPMQDRDLGTESASSHSGDPSQTGDLATPAAADLCAPQSRWSCAAVQRVRLDYGRRYRPGLCWPAARRKRGRAPVRSRSAHQGA